MGFLVLGLLGTALLGAVVFDWFDDDDNSQNDDTSPKETGQELSYDGSDLREGTKGHDTLPAVQDEGLAPDAINLLGADDIAIIEVNRTITVSGGDGDDSITATGVLNILEGGAGNDALTADDSNQLFGGEGDDVLDFTHCSYDQGDPRRVNGGAGDDTINLRAEALITEDDLTNVGGVGIHGGDGSDEINIVYDLNELDGIQTPADGTITRGFESISDFNPTEDSLVIEVAQGNETEDRNVTVEFDQTEDNGTYTSLIRLTFEKTSEAAEGTNTLTILSSAPFTLDDIQLVGA